MRFLAIVIVAAAAAMESGIMRKDLHFTAIDIRMIYNGLDVRQSRLSREVATSRSAAP
jgi:hypothetical protein